MIPVIAGDYRQFTYWINKLGLDHKNYFYAGRPEHLYGYHGQVAVCGAYYKSEAYDIAIQMGFKIVSLETIEKHYTIYYIPKPK